MIIGHYMTGLTDPGGVGNYIRRISRAQRESGHTVRHYDHISRSQESTPEVTYVRDDASLFSVAAGDRVDILHVHTNVEVSAATALPVIRTLHGHWPYCPSGSRYLLARGKPCDRAYNPLRCMWGHCVDRCGSIRPANVMEGFQRTWKERRTLPHIPVITVSDFLRREMIRNGYPESRIHVLHTYSPPPRDAAPPPRDGVPRFAYIGRITPQKGVDWLVRAASRTKAPLHIDIAGDGYYEADVKRLANKLGAQDRVTFHGWLNSDAVNSILSNARALIFPSVWHEAGGAVAGEAMVNHRAVVMSRVGGMPEYVFHDRNGLLVEPNDDAGLAEALDRLAGDWDLACRLGEEGARIAQEKFAFSDHIQTLECLYAKTVTSRRGAL
jgi:glycosyltransferase involved in cell wall biosynthesis